MCSTIKQNCPCVSKCVVEAKKEKSIFDQIKSITECLKGCKKTGVRTTCTMIGACQEYRLENQKEIMSLPTSQNPKKTLKSALNSRLCMFRTKYSYHKIWSIKGCFQGLQSGMTALGACFVFQGKNKKLFD